jgi:hypothetical protein
LAKWGGRLFSARVVNVICMKWGTKFGPEYVNRLHSMVSRHLKRAHQFVCFTDDGNGLREGIRALPLPTMFLPPGKERGWRKLSTFTSPLADLKGPILFLDVDLVIIDSIDCLFDHPGKFCIIKDWARPWRITGNSSVYRFEANAHPDIFAHFLSNIDEVKKEVRNEQEYLTREIHKQGALTYWPRDWCVSFKYGCMPKFPLNFFKAPRIPVGAKIVVFHGLPTPADAIVGKGKGLLRHVKPTAWIADHWR